MTGAVSSRVDGLVDAVEHNFPDAVVLSSSTENSSVTYGSLPGRSASFSSSSEQADSSSPHGLVVYRDNCPSESIRVMLLRMGVVDEEEIQRLFGNMLYCVEGAHVLLQSKTTGKVYPFRCKSRWNSESKYHERVYRELESQIKDLRHVTLLTLTVKPSMVEALMPPWWTLGVKPFMVYSGNSLVSGFLRLLRKRCKRRGRPWNYIACVPEFHKSGMLHYHFIFYGKWVAPIDDILRMWGLCERQGVDVKVRSGKAAVKYVGKYIGKGLRPASRVDEDTGDLCKYFWWFKSRMYNTRHRRENRKGDSTFGIPGDEYVFLGIGYGGNYYDENAGILYRWESDGVECQSGYV